MSVVRMLTRLCSVAALRGHTWAGDRVFDSDNTPLQQALKLNDAAKPYIVVYTDSDNRPAPVAHDVYVSRRELAIVLEIGVASKVTGDTGTERLNIPLTDEGMEIALDMVEEQAIAALFGDPQSDWTELLKHFVLTVDRVSGQRGASADRDHRWAARQLSFVCDIVSDLPIGVPIPFDHPIRRFVDVAKAHPEAQMEHAAEICRALASRGAAPEWEQVQALLGVRRYGLRAIGLAPLAAELTSIAPMYGDDLTDGEGEAPILRKIAVESTDMGGDKEDAILGIVRERSVETNVAAAKLKEEKDKVAVDGENPE
jgi:hypothetical protein